MPPLRSEQMALDPVLVPREHECELPQDHSHFDKVRRKYGGVGKGDGSWNVVKDSNTKQAFASELHAGLASLRLAREAATATGHVQIFQRKQYAATVSLSELQAAIEAVDGLLRVGECPWNSVQAGAVRKGAPGASSSGAIGGGAVSSSGLSSGTASALAPRFVRAPPTAATPASSAGGWMGPTHCSVCGR